MPGGNIRTVIANQRSKFAVLVIWFLVVFVLPLVSLLPAVQDIASGAPSKLVASEDDAVFRRFMTLVEQNKWKDAYAMVSSEAQDVFSESDLQGIGSFTKNMTDSMEIVAAQFNSTKTRPMLHWGGSGTSSESDGLAHDTTVYNLTYEVKNNDAKYPYALVDISGIKRDGDLSIAGFHVNLRSSSMKDVPKFDFGGMNLTLVILAILLPLFIVYTALDYISASTNPRWTIFLVIILLNMYVYVVGDTFSLRFGFNSFVSQTPLGTWAFIPSVPLGAIYYWMTRTRHLQSAAVSKSEVPDIRVPSQS